MCRVRAKATPDPRAARRMPPRQDRRHPVAHARLFLTPPLALGAGAHAGNSWRFAKPSPRSEFF